VTTCPFEGSFRVFDPSNPNRCQALFGTAALAQSINGPTSVPFVGANQVSSPQPTLTYYGHLALTKRWETVTAALSYDRSTSTASGLGTSTNVDSVGGSLVWTPTSMWSVTLTSSYSLQTSAGETQQPLLAVTPLCQVVNTPCIPGTVGALAATATGVTSKLVNNGFEFTTYRVGLNVSRKLTKRLTLIGIGDWYQQENAGSSLQSTTTSDVRFQFGFTYTFDPIPLWTKDL
jgi:hypothetical protein